MHETRFTLPYSLLAGEIGFKHAQTYKTAIVDLYGPDGWSAHEIWRKSNGLLEPDVDLLAIDRHFLRRVGQFHRFPPRASFDWLGAHWRRSLYHGGSLVDNVTDLAIPKGGTYHYAGQWAEVQNHSSRPTSLLKDMATPRQGEFDPRQGREVQFEIRRNTALAIIAGDFEAFIEQAKLHDRDDKIKGVLNKRVFENRGSVERWQKYGYFDSTTNEYKGIGDDPTPPDEYTDVKSLFEFTRSINGIGPVIFTTRVKTPVQSGIKALIESKNKGGNINTVPFVEDLYGGKVILINGDLKQVKLVRDMVTQALQEEFPGTQYIDKDKPKATRRQNPKIAEGQRRRLFEFPDQRGVFYEFYFRTLESEMNSVYRNGVYNLKKGRLEGWGHLHYELDRADLVFDLLLPHNIYELDKRMAIVTQSITIADQLRREKTIHFGKIRPELMVSSQAQPLIVFETGSYVITQPEGSDQLNTYKIVGTDKTGVILERGDGTTFKVHPQRIGATGRIGSEEFLGTQKWLMLMGEPLRET